MKKNKTNDLEQNRKLRRLGLNRETIRVLNDPALLALARGVGTWSNPEDPGGCITDPGSGGC